MFTRKGSIAFFVFAALLISSWLVSCSTTPPAGSAPIIIAPTPSNTSEVTTIPPTEESALTETETIIPTQSVSEVELQFPLSKTGKYFAGKLSVEYAHPWMENFTLDLRIFYPAERPDDFTGTVAWDAVPDNSSAPYPVLLCSTINANELAPHVVSHGFVIVSVEGQKSYDILGSK